MQSRLIHASLSVATVIILVSTLNSNAKLTSKSSRVKLGNERFVENYASSLKGVRLGLVINQTSILPNGQSLINTLLEKGCSLKAIFSPEHGFAGNVEAGSQVENSRFQNIKIFSLYGGRNKPTPEQCSQVDAFVYDIQDVGTRFYTYITTLKYILQTAAETGKVVYVLDRPDPAGGLIVEGPLLRPQFKSFIGSLPLPLRYGLTAGELALMMKGEGWVDKKVKLEVVTMKNWKRKFLWTETGLNWIPPSPNMPTPETALAYPGTGLLGGVNLNQGLGTSNPFLIIGAPWLEPGLIIESLDNGREFGLKLEKVSYTPRSLPGKVLHPPYENRFCRGLRLHFSSKEKTLSVRFTLALIKILKEHYPQKIKPRTDSLNLLFGSDLLVRYLQRKISYKYLLSQIVQDEEAFKKQRRLYLLYN